MTNFCQACGGQRSLYFSTLPGCRCVNPPPLPVATSAMTLEQTRQWIADTWKRCQDEVWRQIPTKHMSREAMKQPEALWLADALDDEFTQGRISNHNGRKAAAELRRLHEVNQDLLKALNTILNICLLDNGHWAKTIEREAHEAIAKTTGEKNHG